MTLKIRTLLLLLLPLSLAQQYFINLVPGYTALPACAQNPVSTIVRGMVSGCGNTQYSSYSCFCTASSAKFVSVISSSVAENCPPTSSMLVSSALDVFADYCRLGGETGKSVRRCLRNMLSTYHSQPTANTAGCSRSCQCHNNYYNLRHQDYVGLRHGDCGFKDWIGSYSLQHLQRRQLGQTDPKQSLCLCPV